MEHARREVSQAFGVRMPGRREMRPEAVSRWSAASRSIGAKADAAEISS